MLTTCNCLCCQRNRAEHGFYYSTSDNSIPCETYFNQELGIGCKKDLQIKDLEQKLAKQSELLAKAVEGLKFYANPNHSYVNGVTTYTKYKQDSTERNDAGYRLVLVGKRARQILKELGE